MVRCARRWEEGIFTLFVDNLPTNVSNVWLRKLFMKEGVVVDTFVSRKRRRGCEGAFGFVRFKKEEEANEAIKMNNNLMIDGKKILVQLSKFSRVQGPNEGGKRLSKGGEGSNQALHGPVQGCFAHSYVEVVNNTLGVQAVGVEKGKIGDGNSFTKDLIWSERDMLEVCVKLLVKRDILEEKVVVVVGDKKMMIHGALINSSLDSGTEGKSMGPGNLNNDRASLQVNIDSLERGAFNEVNESVFVDPLIDDLSNEGKNPIISFWGSINSDECLFPEILNESGSQVRGVRNSGLVCEGQGESSPVCLGLRPRLNTERVHEYTGLWAPGYFKEPIFEAKRKQSAIIVDAISSDSGKDRGTLFDKGSMEKTIVETSLCSSSGHINLALKIGSLTRVTNVECEGIEDSLGSDLSLPPGFGPSIPGDVVKAAKVKKKLEGKMRSGRSILMTTKDGPIKNVRKTGKKSISNSITPKGVMDFALLMGLNIDGKEDGTQL